MQEKNLSRQFEEYMIGLRQAGETEATVDDFFDHACIPESQRSDFVLAVILNDVNWDLIEQTPIQERLF